MKIFFTCFVILMVMFSSWIHDAAAQQVPTVTPVSDRTPQVRDAIVAAAGVPANVVTEAHLAAITSLDLSLKKITRLKAGDFDGLNNLTVLYLPNNELSTLPSGIFDNLTQLTRLLLGNNKLSSLPSDIFDNLTQLTRLDLWSNNLSSLPSDIFDNLTQLTDLSLRYNQLSTLPSGIFDNLTQLTWLWMGENELSTLPSDIFDNLTQLIWLYLPENELSTLPSGIFDNLTQLRALLLRQNELSTLPSDIFDNLTQLGSVSLSENELSTLPSDIFDNLTQLELLYLNDNQLSTLPSGIFDNLTQLELLYLNDNQLSTLPSNIFAGLTELTSLRLQGNAVDPLPLPVSLEAVSNGTFKAVASTGAPFDIVLPLVVANGSLTTGATTVTISTGQVESTVLTVNRTPGTSGAVTVNIGVLPGIPTDVDSYNQLNHQGYALVKSGTLPLVVISGIVNPPPPTDDPPPPTNNPPVFTEGASTTRTIAENTAAGTNIGSAVSATDADNNTLTYTLSGTDAAAFSIVSTTGQLRTLAALDYETKSIYTVVITASDGSLTDTISVRINITDIDEVPPNTMTPVSDRTPQVRDAIVAAAGVPANVVTEAHLAAITSLDLSLKKIRALKAGDFDGLNNLTVLYLPNNELSTLPFGIFDNLTQLTRLLLGNNKLSSLPSNIFDNLTQLTELHLWSNELSTLPSGIFDNLTQLTELHLRYNELSTLPSNIFDNLTQLAWLWLGDNELSTLPSGIFDNLTQLIWLYLPDNNLSTLPSDIFDNLTQLGALLLDNNELSSLPSDIFDNLTQLGALHLSGNELSTLPSDIFDNLTQLESLLLNSNELSTLPSGIFAGLTELTTLRLQGNAVDPLPLPVSLETVGNGVFKAVASTGAPFDIVLPLVVANGSLTTGATTVTISKGQVESAVLTVNRTPGASGAVTVNIGVLPGIPTDVGRGNVPNHQGYSLVKSGTLPLVVISGIADPPPPIDDPPPPIDDPPPPTNNPPVFAEGASTTRTIAENTVAGTHIGSAVSATDADNDTLTYTLNGTDAAAFSIVSTTGQLRTLAALDYETKSIYTVAITASDGSLTDTISVTITVTDIDEDPPNRVTPVSDRTPQVRDAIVAAAGVPANAVTEAHLAAIRGLNLSLRKITRLKTGDFDGLNNLTELYLYGNELSTLPTGIFNNLTQLTKLWLWHNNLSTLPSNIFNNLTQLTELDLHRNQLSTLPLGIFDNLTQLTTLYLNSNELSTLPSDIFDNLTQLSLLSLSENQLSTLPSGIFAGLTELTTLRLQGNAVDPLPLPVSLEAVSNGVFKAVASTGAPFDIVLPLVVANGSLTTDATTVTISKGRVESASLTVNRTPGTSGAVTVNIGGLPGIPTDVSHNHPNHQGYALVKSGTLPLEVISGIADPPPPTNNPPVFAEGASTTRTIAENTVVGTHIGSAVSATDADNDTLTYTLSGTDAAAFSIVSTTGQLRTQAALNAAIKSVYSVTVTVSDGKTVAVSGGVRTVTISVTINVTDVEMPPVLDVNSDGIVDITDLVMVAVSFGATVDPTTPNPADVNDDGVVDLTDLLLVIGGMGSTGGVVVAAAPVLSEANLRYWIAEAKRQALGDATFEKGIAVLEQLLDAVRPTPKETLLLPNYPNPFNPETWIPYHLATDAEVTVTISDVRGVVVRQLVLGHKPAGIYHSRSRAAHWDGRNAFGEKVASGVYFYIFTAGDFTATRKMLIQK